MITGHLQEKGGKFYMVINLKNEQGKWKPKWFSTRLPVKGNKTAACKMLRDKIRELEEVEAQQMTMAENIRKQSVFLFTDYLEKWLKLIRPQVEETTFSGYRSLMDKRIVPYFRPLNLMLHEVEPKHIKAYYDYLLVERNLTANTVKHHHANIRKALQMAMRDDLIPSNPADRVDVPKIKPYIAAVYNRDELWELFECIKGKSLELPVKLAAYYGLRAGEICGLRWTSIDFTNGTITINHIVGTATDEEGKIYTVKRNRTKNASSYRTLPLIPEIEALLIDRKTQAEERMRHFGNSYDMSHKEYICTGKLGKLLIPVNLSRYFREMLAYYELKHIRFHDLRHSCASLLLANGISMKEIQDWLGHSSYTTTANIYAHLDSNSKEASANVMQMVLGEQGGTVKGKKKKPGQTQNSA